jgi:hypothetical protein
MARHLGVDVPVSGRDRRQILLLLHGRAAAKVATALPCVPLELWYPAFEETFVPNTSPFTVWPYASPSSSPPDLCRTSSRRRQLFFSAKQSLYEMALRSRANARAAWRSSYCATRAASRDSSISQTQGNSVTPSDVQETAVCTN